MKINILKNKTKKFEAVALGLIGFLIITFNKISFCQQAYKVDFDQQVFLYWDYLKSLNLIPFRDYFYPYGLLLHFKSVNIGWYLIYLFILYLISVFVFLSFRFIFKERKNIYFFYLIYSIFIFLFVNPDTYIRYAPLVIFSLLISYLSSKKKLITKYSGFAIGLIIGLFFSFINDIFFYSSLVYAIFIIVYYYVNKKTSEVSFSQIFIHASFGLGGFLIGVIPLIIYLKTNHILLDFIFYYNSLSGFYQLAKVAFPPSLKSLENVLIISGLILSIYGLFNMYKRKKIDFKFYYLLSLILVIFSLEQKNLIRSMYEQISFISLITLFILISEFRINVSKTINKKYFSILCINIVFLIFLIISVDRNFKFDKSSYSFSEINISQCVDKKIKNIDKLDLTSYYKVIEYIKMQNNAKIFSFPGDPIFYILLSQKPPYYPSIYEATPVSAQNKLIKYIRDNNVEYIIINTKYSTIQDNVPDKLRAKVLYEYILKNFQQDTKIDNFLLLKSSKN